MIRNVDHAKQLVRKWKRQQEAAGSKPLNPKLFSLDWEREFLPHYLTKAPSIFHAKLIDDLSTFHTVRGQKRNYRGPRISGKTSHLSKAYPLHCALEGNEPFILLTAETGPSQSEAYLSAIKSELEGNEAIAKAYPHACGVGPRWQSDWIKLRNGCTIVARGSASRVLGISDRNVRPTLVIGDDLNARSDAYSPTVRDRRMQWWQTDIMNIGTPGVTNFITAGTSIHDDAVVCQLSRLGTWQTTSFKAVIEWPRRMDLWAEWERLLTNLADANRGETARTFYDLNAAEMNAGAQVLWPEMESLYQLMELRADIGPAAFASEKLDEPGVDGATEWPPEMWKRLEENGMWFDQFPADTILRVVACDPSKGSDSRAGDWQAIVSAALGKDGKIYIDASLRREPVATMALRFAQTAKDWGRCDIMCIEENGTLGLILPEVQRAMKEIGYSGSLKGITQTLSKVGRIRRIGGRLDRGEFRFRTTAGTKELIKQLKQFPAGEHDDGPDAMELALRMVEELVGRR